MDDLRLLKGHCASNKLEPFKYCAREQKVLNLQVVALFHVLMMAICEPTIELEAFLPQLQRPATSKSFYCLCYTP
jgi:hypothetical protein